MSFFNAYTCPRCKEIGTLADLQESFSCLSCGARLKSNATVAGLGALFIGGLPTMFVGEVGFLGGFVLVAASVGLTILLWRTFLAVRLLPRVEDDA